MVLKSWTISVFFTWAVRVNPKIQLIVISLASTKMEEKSFVPHILWYTRLETIIMCLKIEVLCKILKKVENRPIIVILNYWKISAVQRCFRGNQRCSALGSFPLFPPSPTDNIIISPLPPSWCSAEQYGSSFCLIRLLQIPVCLL